MLKYNQTILKGYIRISFIGGLSILFFLYKIHNYGKEMLN